MARPKIYCRQINFAPVEDHQPAKPQDVPSRRRRRACAPTLPEKRPPLSGQARELMGAVPQVGLEPTTKRLLIWRLRRLNDCVRSPLETELV